MIFVMVMLEDREEAEDFIAACEEEDLSASIVLEVKQLQPADMQ